MEEINKLMIEKDYKPILVFKYGVKGATFEQIDQLRVDKKGEFGYLTRKYEVIILTNPEENFYMENVEIISPFFI